MHRSLSLLVTLAFLTAGIGCGPTVNLEEARSALLALDREWSQVTKEPEKFVAFFADGAAIYPPGMPLVTGTDAIRKTYTEMAKAPGFALSFAPTKAEVATSGDLGYTTGSYEMTMGGVSERGKYVTTWKKQADGAWKVTEDIFNADAMPSAPAGTHAMVAANTIKWGPGPPGLPAGGEMAVISGDPSKAEPYVLRARMPANYRIPPHWHPVTENVTVLSGTVAFGMGEKLDPSTMQDLPAGGFASMPSEMRHTFMTRTAATIQVHGMGPFGITYVNAADDPRTK